MLKSGVIRKFVAIPDYSEIGEGVTATSWSSFTNDESVSEEGRRSRSAESRACSRFR